MNMIPREKAAMLRAPDFDTRYFRPNRPVVLTDEPALRKAVCHWLPQSLKDRFADRPVVLTSSPAGIFDYNETAGKLENHTTPLGKALDLITSDFGYRYYIAQRPLAQVLPELAPDLSRPSVMGAAKRGLVSNIWISGKGCKTPLHYDFHDNFLAQIHGVKRITLFPPTAIPYLYPAVGARNPHVSQVNVFAPDQKAFPLFAGAASERLGCDLGPGNVLFIPVGWWHAVESLAVSISVNLWWKEI